MIIKQTIYGMQDLFENFRNYSILTEEQLLVEGRIDNTKKKYPELAKPTVELDGESLLDALIQADPSGNQKYLMGAAKILQNSMEQAGQTAAPFWGKKWPEDAGDDLYSPWGIANNIAIELPRFHKLQPFIQTARRDINTIKDYGALRSVVDMGALKKQNKEREKKQKEEERETASSTSRVITTNDDFTMIRPESAEASCYYGQGAQWCISATKSENYYEQYTAEGKAFYFIFLGHLSHDNIYKKLAMVITTHYGVGQYEETFDAENNSILEPEVIEALIQNLLHQKEAPGALMTYQFYEEVSTVDEPTKKDDAEYLAVLKRLGISWDSVLAETEMGFAGEALEANEKIQGMAHALFKQLKEWAEEDAVENPPGPNEEAYRKIESNYSFDHINVDVEFPDETGAEQVTFTANMYIDVTHSVQSKLGHLKWKIDLEDLADSDVEEIKDAVERSLNKIHIWPEIIETSGDFNTGAEFHVTLESGNGSPDSYEEYLTEIAYQDSRFDDSFGEILLDELQEKDLMGRSEKEEEYWPDPEEKKKQIELPLQENQKGKDKMKLTKETLKQLIREEIAKLYE